MEKKFSKETLFSIFSRENTLVNTFKFAANVTMAMLFVTFFASCTGESLELDPTAAQSLMADSTSQKGLGWHLFTAAATAVDKSGKTIAANLSIRYEGDKITYVDSEEELGLPVTMSFEDGNVFKTSDGITINRTENHSGNAVIGVYGGNFSGGFLGKRLNDSTQVCYVQLTDTATVKADNMPSKFVAEWAAKKISVVEYHRIWRKPAAPTIETMYRPRIEFVENLNGTCYYDLFLEKSTDGGQSWIVVTKYPDFVASMFGQWKPNVLGSLLVNSYNFETKDEPVEMAKDKDQTSKDGNWKRINTIAKEYRWCDEFSAPADASGNTIRTIGGAQIFKVWKAICTNPETGEEVVFDFSGEITSTHGVDKTTGVYTRTVSINLNGEVIETQTGSVQLELAQ